MDQHLVAKRSSRQQLQDNIIDSSHNNNNEVEVLEIISESSGINNNINIEASDSAAIVDITDSPQRPQQVELLVEVNGNELLQQQQQAIPIVPLQHQKPSEARIDEPRQECLVSNRETLQKQAFHIATTDIVVQPADDPDFLELWVDDEFENNLLFADHREPHEKPPPRPRKSPKRSNFRIPLRRRTIKAPSPSNAAVVHRINPNPFAKIDRKKQSSESNSREKAPVKIDAREPSIASVVHRVKPNSHVRDIQEQFERKRSNRQPHSSIEAKRPRMTHSSTPPKVNRSASIKSRPKPTGRGVHDQSSQTTFDCNNCVELLRRLKAAEDEIKTLRNQLADKSCEKCTKRTQGRNIRNRIKQNKLKEFYRAHVNKSYFTTSQTQ